jgi:hypothetical protein
MRNRILPLVLVCGLALAGCKKSPQARLEGHWRGSKVEGVSADVQAAANLFAVGMELDFKGDTVSVRTVRDKTSSKYKVVRSDKSSVVIVTDADGANDEQTLSFITDDSLKWKALEGKTVTFLKEQ